MVQYAPAAFLSMSTFDNTSIQSQRATGCRPRVMNNGGKIHRFMIRECSHYYRTGHECKDSIACLADFISEVGIMESAMGSRWSIRPIAD